MGHQTGHISGRTGDSGDAVTRTIGVGAVPEKNLAIAFDLLELVRVEKESSFLMGDGKDDPGARGKQGGEGSVDPVDDQIFFLANKCPVPVRQEDPRQKTGFCQNLEPVADAQHRKTLISIVDDEIHHRGLGGNGSGSQIISIRESSGKNQGGETGIRPFPMGDPDRVETGDQCDGFPSVEIAVCSGEADDSDAKLSGHERSWVRLHCQPIRDSL